MTTPVDGELHRQLEDIVRLCRRCEALAAQGRAWFDGDPILEVPHLAADSMVLKLGEAVRRLPEGFLHERAADPTWRRAIGMRHRIAHEYDAIDYEIVWQVISVHAAALRERVEEFLGREP
ncbi:MAG: HepT-like ribonuclease domain-containing protein [Luteococcus japonicus]